MFLSIFDIINVPLGWVLQGIEWLVQDYGWSILIFAILAKAAMVPSAIKAQKNQLRMKAFQPKMKQLAQKYRNDTRNPKYQEELQELYTKEGYSPFSGCLPQLIQLPIILSLWTVIRYPLTYICNFSQANLYNAAKCITDAGRTITGITKDLFANGWSDSVYNVLKANEINIADAINANRGLDGLGEAIEHKSVIETEFLGINLGSTAQGASAGLTQFSWMLLIPLIAALSSFAVSFISMRINRAQDDNPAAKSMNFMMFTMPLLSLWIGYSMQFGVALYWIATNVLSLVQTVLLSVFIKEKKEEKPVKEKKMNYTQIEKMRREGLLNGEVADIDENKN